MCPISLDRRGLSIADDKYTSYCLSANAILASDLALVFINQFVASTLCNY